MICQNLQHGVNFLYSYSVMLQHFPHLISREIAVRTTMFSSMSMTGQNFTPPIYFAPYWSSVTLMYARGVRVNTKAWRDAVKHGHHTLALRIPVVRALA
jgi:hypothetical protein